MKMFKKIKSQLQIDRNVNGRKFNKGWDYLLLIVFEVQIFY